ncbi:MAG: enoyl-CoA hydratase/isomerase family protein [Rhodospirillales bacterium]|jgi:enoyl-CoA hydratase|nr:enoyl-CoA hydratase/isomerase family protein [Rhodospirillales bacterium]MDP6772648.1 enoyl-CoA hydratase/isomerase family protein [Rhodospirillales bacterium]
MAYKLMKYREKNNTAYITLNRPKVINCLNIALSEELYDAIWRIRNSKKLDYVVIKGAGGNFCAGDDLKEMQRGAWGDANQAMHRVRFYQNMANQLEELDKITVAAVDGYAVGGGLEITMVCDFVIATERARWGMPEVDVGITPGWGGTTRLTRLIGRRLSKEVNLVGSFHSAKRAVREGLWNRVVPNGKLDAEVEKLLALLRTKNQQGLRQLKFTLNRNIEADLYTAQGFEAMGFGLTAAVNGWWRVDDADKGKGLKAFRDKNTLWNKRRNPAIPFWSDED